MRNREDMGIDVGRWHRWSRVLRGLAVCAALLALAATVARAQESLTGHLLVATERMGDPRFEKTVIYMLEHGETGAMGLVVNVPLGETSFDKLFEQLGLPAEPDTEGTVAVYYGGPVEPGRGFLLHSDDVLIEGSHRLKNGLAVTAEPGILRALARGEGPADALFTLGYAGWAPGQLESELARDSWVVVPGDESLVFAVDPAQTWARAMASRGIDL